MQYNEQLNECFTSQSCTAVVVCFFFFEKQHGKIINIFPKRLEQIKDDHARMSLPFFHDRLQGLERLRDLISHCSQIHRIAFKDLG